MVGYGFKAKGDDIAGAPRVGSRVSWAIPQAGVVLLLPLVSVLPAVGGALGDHSGDDVLFGVVYISMFFLAAAAVWVVIYRIQRGARNRHTGLPRPIKRRRARGPLKNARLD